MLICRIESLTRRADQKKESFNHHDYFCLQYTVLLGVVLPSPDDDCSNIRLYGFLERSPYYHLLTERLRLRSLSFSNEEKPSSSELLFFLFPSSGRRRLALLNW